MNIFQPIQQGVGGPGWVSSLKRALCFSCISSTQSLFEKKNSRPIRKGYNKGIVTVTPRLGLTRRVILLERRFLRNSTGPTCGSMYVFSLKA